MTEIELAPQRHAPQETPREFVVEGESLELADGALQYLASEPIADVFQRGRGLVRVVSDGVRLSKTHYSAGSPVIERLTPVTLRDRLARLGEWSTFKGRRHLEILPPAWLVNSLLERAAWPGLPYLDQVVEAPTMRQDGSILFEAGYDPKSQILHYTNGKSSPYPPVKLDANLEDATLAAATLIEPLHDFPFVSVSDRAAAVSAILSLVARPAIDGCVPLYAIRSPSPGTGKSLLADIISIVGTGRPAPRTCMDHDTTEFKKQVLAIALEGAQLTLLDNLTGRVGSAVFSEAVTSSAWNGRVLGESRNVTVPLRTIWIATGNNVTFKYDLGRRVVVIDLNAEEEHPEDRMPTDERFKNGMGNSFLGYVLTNRPRYVHAALTLLRAFHNAGRPTHGQPAKGSFESWDSLVRAACCWANLGDPDEGKERVRADDDTDLLNLGTILEEVNRVTQGHPFTIAELMVKAESDEDLRNALVEFTGRDKVDAHRVGNSVRSHKERPVGGLMFVKSSERVGTSKVARWKVRELNALGLKSPGGPED